MEADQAFDTSGGHGSPRPVRPAIKREQRPALLLKLLRTCRGSHLPTVDIQHMVREAGESFSVRAVLEALHLAGEVFKLKQGRGSRACYTWAVPA